MEQDNPNHEIDNWHAHEDFINLTEEEKLAE